jgi:hypothetical protein
MAVIVPAVGEEHGEMQARPVVAAISVHVTTIQSGSVQSVVDRESKRMGIKKEEVM